MTNLPKFPKNVNQCGCTEGLGSEETMSTRALAFHHSSSGISSTVPTEVVGGYLLIAEAAVLCCHHDKRSSGSTRFLITVTKNINFLTRSFFFNGIDFSTKCFAQKMTKSQPWKHSFLALKIQFFFSLLTVYFVRTLVCKYGSRGELNNFRR